MTNQKRYRRSQRSEKRRYMCLFLVLALLLCAELAVAWHMDRTKKEAAAQQASEIAQQEETSQPAAQTPVSQPPSQTQENTPVQPGQSGGEAQTQEEAPLSQSDAYQYYIKVNYEANVVTVYTKDSQGRYSVPSRAMLCSTGVDTPKSGVFDLYGTGRWQWLGLFDGVYGQYCTQITGDILFHSVPYLERGNKASLEYWEFDKLGTSCSMGCVRLQAGDAQWIYEHHTDIESVEFYAASDPGPLGKPQTPQISGNESCRDWDPTDPDSGNPWLSA